MWISRELSVDVRSPGGKMAANVHPMHTADDGGDVPGGCCCRTPSHAGQTTSVSQNSHRGLQCWCGRRVRLHV